VIPGLSPQDIGLPAKFRSWRPGQLLALDRGLTSTKRFMAHSMPTGEGKGGLAVGTAMLMAKRTCFLTSTKGLQDQYQDEFHSIGLCDMRGRNNYPCSGKGSETCEEGQYTCRRNCNSYEKARDRMIESSLVVSNYSYFMLSNLYGRGMGEFDLLVCDECHDVPDEICSAMAVTVSYAEAQKIQIRFPQGEAPISSWWAWAKDVGKKAIQILEDIKLQAEADISDKGHVHPSTAADHRFWTKISHKCISILASEGDLEWIVERTGDGYKLEPIWAHQYAQKILFMQIPKIILISATMVKKTISLLGIPDDQIDFYEYHSSFPARRSPVYYWEGQPLLRLDHKTPPHMFAQYMARIDNFLRTRQDRKGIIHSVSYDRARQISDISEFGHTFITPQSGRETAQKVEQFKKADPPATLVSPAITTGYDFAFSAGEYNILAKVPFLDTRGKLITARQEKDPEYAPYITAQTIVQAHGRTMRAETDQSETAIPDDHFRWVIRQFKHLFPFWFHRLITPIRGRIPEPPAPLPRVVATSLPSNPSTSNVISIERTNS
jgi:Rad3-related DNA helicase